MQPAEGFRSHHGLARFLGRTRVATSSRDAQQQLDTHVAAGVQQRDVFADVTSGSKTTVDRPEMEKQLGSSLTHHFGSETIGNGRYRGSVEGVNMTLFAL